HQQQLRGFQSSPILLEHSQFAFWRLRRFISMRRRTVAFPLACLTILSLFELSAAGGAIATSSQTQSTSAPGVLVATDWGPGTGRVSNPLPFAQIDPRLGTLNAIENTLSTTIRNDFILNLVQTPIPTTLYLATSSTSDPSVLADPAKRALL